MQDLFSLQGRVAMVTGANTGLGQGIAIALACKDLGLSIDLARSVGAPSELSALVEQIYRRARAQYGDLAGENGLHQPKYDFNDAVINPGAMLLAHSALLALQV